MSNPARLEAVCYHRLTGARRQYRVYDWWYLCQYHCHKPPSERTDVEKEAEGMYYLRPIQIGNREIKVSMFATPTEAEDWAIRHPELCARFADCQAYPPEGAEVMNPKHGPITTQVTYKCQHIGSAQASIRADIDDLKKIAASMPCPGCRQTRRLLTTTDARGRVMRV